MSAACGRSSAGRPRLWFSSRSRSICSRARSSSPRRRNASPSTPRTCCSTSGWCDERAACPSGGERQRLLHEGLAAARLLRRRREQQVVDEEALHGARLLLRGARAIALRERDEQAGRQAGEGERRGGEGEAMPGDELPRPIEPRAGERFDRKAGERAADVVGERGDRGVALLRILAQRLEADLVEVPRRAARAQAARDLARTLGLALDDLPGEGERAGRLDSERPLPGKQLEQQEPERMDVGRRRRRLALDLFRRGVARRQQVVDAARQAEVVLLEELGDAEVEELHLALAGDEDVRRLEVAVHHQVRMRIGDRVAHLEEDRELGREGESGLGAEAIDRHALDVLEREVRGAVLRDPAVDETRDARMLEPRQDLALAFEPQAELARAHRRRQQLDRDALLEGTVGTLGEEDLAHSAGADRVQ